MMIAAMVSGAITYPGTSTQTKCQYQPLNSNWQCRTQTAVAVAVPEPAEGVEGVSRQTVAVADAVGVLVGVSVLVGITVAAIGTAVLVAVFEAAGVRVAIVGRVAEGIAVPVPEPVEGVEAVEVAVTN